MSMNISWTKAMRHILAVAVISCLCLTGVCVLLYHHACEDEGCIVYAGTESDGSEADLLQPETFLEEPSSQDAISDEPVSRTVTEDDGTSFSYSEVMMKPGEIYDVSEYNDKATYLAAYYSGTYLIKGQSDHVILFINARSTDEINIVFGDSVAGEGVHMVATKNCPGTAAKARSVIEIHGEQGGKVTLTSAKGQTCYFRGKGPVPAIRKDGTDVALTFDTADPDDPGTFHVEVDPSASRTSAIGCYSGEFVHNKFGNVTFENGIIEAYGSGSGTGSGQVTSFYDGGPGIGADYTGSVEGITFVDADVTAVAGNLTSAAIGTASCMLSISILGADRHFGVVCDNIRIKGGKITARHEKPKYSDGEGGAGI